MHLGELILYIYAGCILVYLIAPIVVVIILSFSSSRYLEFPPPGWSWRWYRSYFASVDWRQSTILSFEVAGITSGLALALGTTTALAIVRGGRSLAAPLQTVVLLPMIVPSIVTAIGLFWLSAKLGLLGSIWSIVVGHTVLALPFVVLCVATSLRGVNPSVERAALSLGAHPWYVFRRVTLPLIRPGVLSGAILAFVTSFEEAVMAIMLSSPTTITLPKRMWDSIEIEVDPTISAAAALLVALSVIFFSAMSVLRGGRWR